jgi:hypothetical protein
MKIFFHENDLAGKELFKRIADACEGLIYVSEIDAPVTAYAAPAAGMSAPDVLLRQINRSEGEAVEEAKFDALFDRLTAIREWFGERETARAKKFLELRRVLEESLDQLTVYRLGKIRIDIFAVGVDGAGRVMGVMTAALET